jgi:hypothetical protein
MIGELHGQELLTLGIKGSEGDKLKLTGKQVEDLTNALVDAFPTPAKMTQMLRFKVNKNLYAITVSASLIDMAYETIITAESEGWINTLVMGALDSNKGNIPLHDFAVQIGISSTVSFYKLEKLIKNQNPFLDTGAWCNKLHSIERQICRIEIMTDRGNSYFGTGFLVGPHHVMTNFHVIEPIYFNYNNNPKYKDEKANLNDVKVLFDYKITDKAEVVNCGVSFKLKQEWLIHFSDYIDSPLSGTYGSMDYAIIALDKNIATENDRGWIQIPDEDVDLKDGDGLLVFQHPSGMPLKLVIESVGVIKASVNQDFFEHCANTLPGSSGSPCFDMQWNLVGLHHSANVNNMATQIRSIKRNLASNGINYL